VTAWRKSRRTRLAPLSHDPTTSLNEAEVIAAIEAVEALMTALRS
jgi:hypothetical protein